MNRKIAFSEGEFYHIYNRGNDKRVIFTEHSDYKRFLALLFFCNSKNPVQLAKINKRLSQGDTLTILGEFVKERGETIVDIGAYCLMPNHFHLLLHEKIENGVTLFLKKLCTAYSMYFNIKNERTGKLFEGVFRAQHADKDEYLKYLFAYIHLNPAKLVDPDWRDKGPVDIDDSRRFIENYQFSSYRSYLEPGRANVILSKDSFPEYFLETDMRNYVEDWLDFGSPELVKVTP